MKLKLNVFPKIVEGKSQQDIIDKLKLHIWCVDKYGSRFAIATSFNDDRLVAINFEKHRKKVKVLKNGKRKVISPKHWIGYFYDFTKYKSFIAINQKQRTFEIIYK